jgi:predicted phosphoribosyltransferase
VAPRATCDALNAEADEVVCLHVPDSFIAIALHYRHY